MQLSGLISANQANHSIGKKTITMDSKKRNGQQGWIAVFDWLAYQMEGFTFFSYAETKLEWIKWFLLCIWISGFHSFCTSN